MLAETRGVSNNKIMHYCQQAMGMELQVMKDP